VCPQSIPFGTRVETVFSKGKNNTIKSVINTGQYVPISKTMQAFDLPPSYYADLSHIHLIAMCNSNDLKSENGLDILLNAIVEDLSDLETKGF
jgi:hypothetical protein